MRCTDLHVTCYVTYVNLEVCKFTKPASCQPLRLSQIRPTQRAADVVTHALAGAAAQAASINPRGPRACDPACKR
jgi:hypothetical protein